MNSIEIKSDDFFDVIRALDRVQERATSNELTSENIKIASRLFYLYSRYADIIYVEVFSAFTDGRCKFPRKCTRVQYYRNVKVNSPVQISISRREAPEKDEKQGKYIVTLVNVNDEIITLPDGFKRTPSAPDSKVLIFYGG